MPDEPNEESEEELEARLKKLLGEKEQASEGELDEIELKLRNVDTKLEDQREARQSNQADFDADFENRLESLRKRATRARQPAPSQSSRFAGGDSISQGSGVGLAFAIGYSFVGPILTFIILGLWLDGWRSGTWTLVGLGVGTAAAFFLLIRLVNRLNDTQR